MIILTIHLEIYSIINGPGKLELSRNNRKGAHHRHADLDHHDD
jgi:hypothetical protein